MLTQNTDQLQQRIEIAVYDALKKAFLESLKSVMESKSDRPVTPEVVADKFADIAKECSTPIAHAIKDYLDNTRVMIPIGTLIPTLNGLTSPMGPVTGVLNVGPAPVIMNNSLITDGLIEDLKQ